MRDLDVTATDATDFRVEEECPRPGLVIVAVHGDLDLHSAGDRRKDLRTEDGSA